MPNNPELSFSSTSSNSNEEHLGGNKQPEPQRPVMVPIQKLPNARVEPPAHHARRQRLKPDEVPDPEKFRQLFQQSRQRDADSKRMRFVIDIEGEFKKVWDSVNTVFMILICVYIPIRLSFLYDVTLDIQASIFEWSANGFFFCDLILNFFTPQHSGTEYEYTFWKRSKVYLKGWFWIDLISVFPLEEAISTVSSLNDSGNVKFYSQMLKVAKTLRLLKLLRTLNLKNTREDNYFFSFIKYALGDTVIFDFLPSICSLLLCTHIASCSWYAVGYFNLSHECWISLSNLHDRPLFDQYIYSVYFVLQTFTTVGYGDVPSVLNSERYMRIIFIITGVVLYTIFTGKIADYQTKKIDAEEVSDLKISLLERISASYELPSVTTINVRETILSGEVESVADGNLDLGQISEEERRFVHFVVFLSELKAIPDIYRLKKPALVEAFGLSLRKRRFGEGQVIYSRGEPASSLYFLERGTVGVMSVLFETIPHHHITKGCFGEYELFKGEPRHFTTVAVTECTVYCMPVEAFKQIYLQTPDKEARLLSASLEAFGNKRHRRYVEGYRELLDTEVKLLRQKFQRGKRNGIVSALSSKARLLLQQFAKISSMLPSRRGSQKEVANQTDARKQIDCLPLQNFSEADSNNKPSLVTAKNQSQLEVIDYDCNSPPHTPRKLKKSDASIGDERNHHNNAEVVTAHSSAKKNTDLDISEDDPKNLPAHMPASLTDPNYAGSRTNPHPKVITRHPKESSPRKLSKPKLKHKPTTATINNF